MFGSIGQPNSGVKDDRTAQAFLEDLQEEAAHEDKKRRRSRRRRQRFFRMIKGWFTADR